MKRVVFLFTKTSKTPYKSRTLLTVVCTMLSKMHM